MNAWFSTFLMRKKWRKWNDTSRRLTVVKAINPFGSYHWYTNKHVSNQPAYKRKSWNLQWRIKKAMR